MLTLKANRVVSSGRRGSSWPIEVETESGHFLLKLRGNGNGSAALVSEIVVGRLAASLGLPVPEIALVSVDPGLKVENRDPELLALIDASVGLNVGIACIRGARDFTPADVEWVTPDLASRVVWFDWWVMNPDRTPRSPNLMIRRSRVWLIDHGSALVFHHKWAAVTEDTPQRHWEWQPFHILEARAPSWAESSPAWIQAVTRDLIGSAVAAVPDDLLRPLLIDATPDALTRRRAAYGAILWKRARLIADHFSLYPGSNATR
jgi:hypothetical protein